MNVKRKVIFVYSYFYVVNYYVPHFNLRVSWLIEDNKMGRFLFICEHNYTISTYLYHAYLMTFQFFSSSSLSNLCFVKVICNIYLNTHYSPTCLTWCKSLKGKTILIDTFWFNWLTSFKLYCFKQWSESHRQGQPI